MTRCDPKLVCSSGIYLSGHRLRASDGLRSASQQATEMGIDHKMFAIADELGGAGQGGQAGTAEYDAAEGEKKQSQQHLA